jgi:hypothetical protein
VGKPRPPLEQGIVVAIVINLPSDSVEAAAGASSTQLSLTLVTGQLYSVTANVGIWVAQGSNPTASIGTGSQYVGPGQVLVVDGTNGSKLAVIADSTTGRCCAGPITRF